MSLMRQHGLKERLLILALVFTVSACGFQLRGSLEISDDLSPLHLEKNSVFDLAREIKALLSTNDIKTVESEGSGAGVGAEKANSQLSLLNESKTRRVLSVDGNGRVREFLLIYTVNYSIKIKQSKLLDESLTVQRSLLFNPDAVLAVVNESEVLYKDMRRDAARLILLKLQAHSRKYESGSIEAGETK